MTSHLLWALLWPPVWALLCLWLLTGRRCSLDPVAWPWACAAAGGLIDDLAGRWWLAGAVNLCQVAIAVLIWWYRRRRDRRKALAALGAKSRALRDALVRRAREAARPRPVLQPAPGGAR